MFSEHRIKALKFSSPYLLLFQGAGRVEGIVKAEIAVGKEHVAGHLSRKFGFFYHSPFFSGMPHTVSFSRRHLSFRRKKARHLPCRDDKVWCSPQAEKNVAYEEIAFDCPPEPFGVRITDIFQLERTGICFQHSLLIDDSEVFKNRTRRC